MPLRRFMAYVNQIPALRAEEILAEIQATSFPHLEKRARRSSLRQLERAAGAREATKKPQGAQKPRMVGELPADVAGFRLLEAQDPMFRGLVKIVRKEKKDQDDASHDDGP